MPSLAEQIAALADPKPVGKYARRMCVRPVNSIANCQILIRKMLSEETLMRSSLRMKTSRWPVSIIYRLERVV